MGAHRGIPEGPEPAERTGACGRTGAHRGDRSLREHRENRGVEYVDNLSRTGRTRGTGADRDAPQGPEPAEGQGCTGRIQAVWAGPRVSAQRDRVPGAAAAALSGLGRARSPAARPARAADVTPTQSSGSKPWARPLAAGRGP